MCNNSLIINLLCMVRFSHPTCVPLFNNCLIIGLWWMVIVCDLRRPVSHLFNNCLIIGLCWMVIVRCLLPAKLSNNCPIFSSRMFQVYSLLYVLYQNMRFYCPGFLAWVGYCLQVTVRGLTSHNDHLARMHNAAINTTWVYKKTAVDTRT